MSRLGSGKSYPDFVSLSHYTETVKFLYSFCQKFCRVDEILFVTFYGFENKTSNCIEERNQK